MATGSDLSQLSDAELAERLETAWACLDEADKKRRSSATFWKNRPTETLPLPVRFWSTLVGSPGFRVIDWTIRAWCEGDLKRRILVSDDAIAVDDRLTDIETITKEIKRRVERRKETA